jgi:hypothetical protein
MVARLRAISGGKLGRKAFVRYPKYRLVTVVFVLSCPKLAA